ncbi:pleckstrin homology domain-containing family A member 4 [Genypterus blacodes]|uniref:pleckstrin homology domain-containing family A member 4 n=1 Tax=Genypterus blacodes TaxID=154954 RepID=UPI003F7696A8
MDKDSVQCALEVSRLQLEEWSSQGPRAHEDAFTQKALLQEELVTIRARMCDVSLEMERVWAQYERMESELSVIRSQLQHICNFGIPQEQSQAQRELWMMEDILAGLKVNRDHFCLLLGLQRHHVSPSAFRHAAPHPGSPGSPTERLRGELSMQEEEQEPPSRPPLPQELQEGPQSRDQGWTESPYEGIYSHAVDPPQRSRKSQRDVVNVKTQKDALESQSGSKWITADTTNQTTKKKGKMSEEEQLVRIKRNQERLANRKKPPLPHQAAHTQGQSSEGREEAPFPLRVTRVVTAVLPTSLVARRVSVEDPPPELNTPLPEQIPPEMQQQSKKALGKPPRRLLLLEGADHSQAAAETHQEQPIRRRSRHQHAGTSSASAKQETQTQASVSEPTETSRTQNLGNGSMTSDTRAEEPRPSDLLLTPDMDPDLCLTPEQREAKLRRVERIRERVIRSAARESGVGHDQTPIRRKEGQEDDASRKHGATADRGAYEGYRSCGNNVKHSLYYAPADLQPSGGTSQDEDEHKDCPGKSRSYPGSKMQRRDHSGRKWSAKSKIRSPPSSPHHISSVTFYQKRGGEGFTTFKDVEEEELTETQADESQSDFSSGDLRAKWFLSTNQWQGFIPLQIHELEAPCEEASDADNQTACADEVTDSNKMSSTVSQSLEKMKENHSLFYKIACDISISDSDIARNDGNSNGQMASRPEEGSELTMSEFNANEDVATVRGPSDLEIREDQVIASARASSNTSDKSEKEASIYEEIPDPVKRLNQDDSRTETDRSVSVQGPERSEEEHSGTKDQERPERLQKSRSLCEEENDSIPPPGVIRSGSFGKARVTVLRTSL